MRINGFDSFWALLTGSSLLILLNHIDCHSAPRPEVVLIIRLDLRPNIVIHINPDLHAEDWHTLVFRKLLLQVSDASQATK